MRDRDAMLVQACLAGDRSAFSELVDSYEGKLFNVAYRITGSRDDAMDVTQATFLKAYEKLHTFDLSRTFFSWIYRIAINEALNLVRRTRNTAPLDLETADPEKSPEESAQEGETRRFVQASLMRLQPDHRAVIVLRHLQGLSYREIAEVLGIPEKTVKSRLFSARRALRTILAEQGVGV